MSAYGLAAKAKIDKNKNRKLKVSNKWVAPETARRAI